MNQEFEPYLFNDGMRKLAFEVVGSERIHMGIRPCGFHAGNVVALYVYPFLFCEEVERLGKTANFTFFVSINDYEQDELDGPDYRTNPFNIGPKLSTLGYTPDPEGCHEYIVDHWLPVIKKSLLKLKERFPSIQIYFVKNSDIKSDIKFKEILNSTLRNPFEQAEIYKRFTDKEVLAMPLAYASVVCPICKRTKGKTTTDRANYEYIKWDCGTCGISLDAPYDHYDYWFYHKPLFTARLCIFNIDISFSGGDHFSEGDFQIRKEFIKRFNPGLKIPKMLFTPLVLSLDGEKMSKSRSNTEFGDPKKLINICKNTTDSQIQINNEMIVSVKKDEEYTNFF